MSIKNAWELLVLDGNPPVEMLGALAAGDVDGDGHIELLVGGEGGLLWYRPDTFERGVVAEGHVHVGLVLEDIAGDGILEAVCGLKDSEHDDRWMIVRFRPGDSLDGPWTMQVIDPHCNGGAHDVCFADIDGDGRNELVANAAYCPVPGIFIYRPDEDESAPWRKHEAMSGNFTEGIAASDLDGDGRLEIVAGPVWLTMPADGPWSGPWEMRTWAPSFREMCRVAAIDITGNGHDDLVITDSEYMDGRLSWFENRLARSPERPWVEHRLEETPLLYSHSLSAWKDGDAIKIFVGEMAQGGWSPPYNHDARLLLYTSPDKGRSWEREMLSQGAGTHEGMAVDIDGDGEVEIVGKECWRPRVTIWKAAKEDRNPLKDWRHLFIDRDKPATGTDILAADVDGDGLEDVICGRWWYRNPDWERRHIPGVAQVIAAYDLDGDGRNELIATRTPAGGMEAGAPGLSNELVWLKAIDPLQGEWREYPIGVGGGDWPHGNAVAPLLPDGGLALIASWHSANQGREHYPQLFEVPQNLRSGPWPVRTLAEIVYGEEMVPVDLTGNGLLDVVAGPYWLENQGDGEFHPHRFVGDADFYSARLRVQDINGNGRLDVVLGEEVLDFESRVATFSKLAWFECPPDPRDVPWPMHVIDIMRCPHSVEVADLDGDGQPEVIAAEHDPFWPYRNQCKLYVYSKADERGRAWTRRELDNRFEHHDGTRLITLAPGVQGIVSHGWRDSRYVHLWTAANGDRG
ncbi:MAG: VCBS repeat-containing protein [Anaerolineaceae bacterium]|nr:VCBS repeat-containing protein [Anaerolineaceae bacterium]